MPALSYINKQIYDICSLPCLEIVAISYIIKVFYNTLEIDAISYIILYI